MDLPKSLEPQIYSDPLMVQLFSYKPEPQPGVMRSVSDGIVNDLGYWWWDKPETNEMFQELATDFPHLNFFVVITTVTTDLEGLL